MNLNEHLAKNILIIAVLAVLCGCGRSQNDRANEPPPVQEKTLIELVDEDVIVNINKEPLMVKDIKREFRNIRKIATWQQKGVPSNQLDMAVDANKRGFLGNYINKRVVEEEAKRLNLKPSDGNIQQVKGTHSAVVQASGLTFDEYCAALEYTVDEYRKRMDRDALRLAARDHAFKDEIKITDEQLEAEKQRYRDYNKRAATTNGFIIATGHKIVKELRDGADFTEMAARYSESPDDEDGYWGKFVRADFEELKVRHVAFTLPVGDISDPIDMDEGLLILKVLNRVQSDNEGSEFTDEVELARILLRMVREFPLPEDEELRGHMLQSTMNALYGAHIKELKAKCDISYPCGTNILQEVQNIQE